MADPAEDGERERVQEGETAARGKQSKQKMQKTKRRPNDVCKETERERERERTVPSRTSGAKGTRRSNTPSYLARAHK